MDFESHNWRRGSPCVFSKEEFISTNNNRPSEFYDIQKCNSDNRYDRYTGDTRNNMEHIGDDYRKRYKYLIRHRGGDNCNDCYENRCKAISTRRRDCDDDDFGNDVDNRDKCERNFGQRRDRARYRDFDADQERYVERKPIRGSCSVPHRDQQWNQDRYGDRYRRKRWIHGYRADPYETVQKKQGNPCNVNVHKVPHSCTQNETNRTQREYGCNPMSCLALKRKNQGAGDTTDECCTCKECPFCLLRLFCVEVLQELAEIKAKKIGGHLEGLLYAEEEEEGRFRPSELVLSRKETFSENTLARKWHELNDSQELRRKVRSSELGRSTDTLGRGRRHRSDENFNSSYRGKHGKYSEDSFERDRGRDRYDRDRNRGRHDRDRNRGRSRRGENGRSDDFDGGERRKDKKDKKKEKQKEKADEPPELPEEVKQELEKAKKKAENEKKKKEKERAKKALIEERLMKASQMTTKSWVVKKYDGPGRFAEVNVCDFMRLRLESMLAREAAIYRVACFPGPCMPPTYIINPKYCCSSFWCPPPSVPAICC